jgi:dienelactone hydrolase
MVRGAVARGYVVFAPLMIMYPYVDRDNGTPIPSDVRQTIGNELAWRSQSLEGIEAVKISKSLDVILKRPEVDRQRVGMIGLSMGGRHSMLTAALDDRIQAVVCSGSLALDHALLVCPRPLQFQFGEKDRLIGVVTRSAKESSARLAALYRRLGVPDRYEWKTFPGGHEFNGQLAWDFLDTQLARKSK